MFLLDCKRSIRRMAISSQQKNNQVLILMMKRCGLARTFDSWLLDWINVIICQDEHF
jgi:hypothetical protein